jgi:hypothetical protein
VYLSSTNKNVLQLFPKKEIPVRDGDVAQATEHLLCKPKALSSKPSSTKKKKKKIIVK